MVIAADVYHNALFPAQAEPTREPLPCSPLVRDGRLLRQLLQHLNTASGVLRETPPELHLRSMHHLRLELKRVWPGAQVYRGQLGDHVVPAMSIAGVVLQWSALERLWVAHHGGRMAAGTEEVALFICAAIEERVAR